MINKYKNIKVSVVIPLFNAENYISETINSIINQTHKNLELIVVDDSSTDSSVDIVEKFVQKDQRITLIKLEKNSGGPSKPRNIALRKAKGNYIAFIDADDTWNFDKLEKQLEFMINNKINFSSTNHLLIDENSNIIKRENFFTQFYKNKLYRSNTTLSSLIFFNKIYTSTVLIDKKLLGKFDEDKLLVAKEDLFLWLEILSKKDVRYQFLNNRLTNYRVLENSISRNQIEKDRIKQIYAISKFILINNRIDLWRALKKLFILRILR